MDHFDSQVITTDAGEYTVRWITDPDAGQPEDEGFFLAVAGVTQPVTPGESGRIVWDVLSAHADHSNYWTWRKLRSGAALVRYLQLRGHKGVTLVDGDYQPVAASTERRSEPVMGVAWAPDDAADPDTYVDNHLAEWRAWAEGDAFGWKLFDPSGVEIDAEWGHYGFDAMRTDTLEQARAVAAFDAESRVVAANTVGAGFVGVI
ncbi:hypothetical protein [Mycolicibacterium sphagni]|uniref:hypothetical protein n=1 Tax=Mycolicibacterium sphagni TaxID=1786 RepID=UPI0021F317B7|nr:hypothetical protein [Mycolicibacterium sphagni]MCV7174829.1 hypothetical protein [Mycolicibacterium sphagni]